MDHAGTRWAAIAAVVLAGVAAATQIGKVPAAMTTIAAEFGLGLAGAALLVGLFGLLAGLGGLAIGLAASRIGARQGLLAGLAIGAAAALVAPLAATALPLFAARIAEGAGFLLITVTAPALIATLAGARDRAFAMGLWGTYMPAGVALGLLTAPVVESLGWRSAWLGCAVLLGAALLLCWRLVPRAEAAPSAGPLRVGAQLRALAAARRPIRIAAAFAAYNCVYLGIAAFLPAFLESLGAGTGLAGGMAALAAVANALGNFAGGVLAGRGASPERLVAGGAMAMAALAGALYLSSTVWLAVTLAMAACCIGGVVPAACVVLLPRSVPDPALVAPAMGLTIQGNNLVQLLAPPALGSLAALSWPLVAAPLLAAGLMAAWMGIALRRPD
ncbi:MAG: MFS transporter [Roseomonas sp.]|nr:MFS transporter [Roseomonas sp.]